MSTAPRSLHRLGLACTLLAGLPATFASQAETTLELVVDELPFEAGIDPYNKLIDRNSGDNRKKAVLM